MAISQYLNSLGDSLRYVGQHLDPSRVLDKMKAYGDISGSTGEYFCNSKNIAVEKLMYKD